VSEALSLSNEIDLSAWWMPFTANRAFKQAPRLFESAAGMYYTTPDGRRVLDGMSGLWCCNAGHCHPRIVEAIREQAGRLDYAPSFQMGHPLPFEVARRLAELAPPGLNRVFFTNSGSESVDTALKIALAYHAARGEGQRTRFIGRERGYHGAGFGGTAVGGIGNNRRSFGPLLAGTVHLPHTHDLARQAFSRGQPQWGAHLADALERLLAVNDASTIAGVIVEPFAGSGGVLIPPVGYLERLRELCTRHGLLLIFDEVISAFGRFGDSFAARRFGVTPDLIVAAKGLTSGTVPMGAVLVAQDIHDALMRGPEDAIELYHGYTYSGHPLACAAALAALDVYRDEGLFERARRLATPFEEAVHSLRGAPHVVDVRNFGLVAGIELAPRPGRPTARAIDVLRHAFAAGVLVRTTADTIAIAPPLVVAEAQVAEIVGVLRAALQAVD
jgi:beta-alanine--pyruvate transaminase